MATLDTNLAPKHGRTRARRAVRTLAIMALALVALVAAAPSGASAQSSSANLTGHVVYSDGAASTPAAGVKVDIFNENRSSYITTIRTDDAGAFDVQQAYVDGSRCFTLTYVAPDGAVWSATSTRYLNARRCAPADSDTINFDYATLYRGSTARINITLQNASGDPEGFVDVDLFDMAADGSRAGFLYSAELSAYGDNAWLNGLRPGCYVVVYQAPAQTPPKKAVFDNGTIYQEFRRCLNGGDEAKTVGKVTVITTGQSHVGGTVSTADGAPVAGLRAQLWADNRALYLSGMTTGADGTFDFTVQDGCYYYVLRAPDGTVFQGTSSQWKEVDNVCVSGGGTTTVDLVVVPR